MARVHNFIIFLPFRLRTSFIRDRELLLFHNYPTKSILRRRAKFASSSISCTKWPCSWVGGLLGIMSLLLHEWFNTLQTKCSSDRLTASETAFFDDESPDNFCNSRWQSDDVTHFTSSPFFNSLIQILPSLFLGGQEKRVQRREMPWRSEYLQVLIPFVRWMTPRQRHDKCAHYWRARLWRQWDGARRMFRCCLALFLNVAIWNWC